MGVKRSSGAALVVVACLSSAGARAEEPAAVTDGAEIHLRSGESKRGTIVAVEPGQRVILIVAGEESVIPWGEIARIVGGPKEPAAAPKPGAPAPAAVERTPEKGMPFVHIESDWPEAELSRVDGDIGPGAYSGAGHMAATSLHRYMCRAPCDKLVDGREGHRFFISALGMYPSPQFRLDGYEGHITARVSGTSFSRFMGGVVAVGAGGLLAVGGAMFIGMSHLIADQSPDAETPDPARESREVRAIGIGFGAVGLAGVALGIALLSGGTTRIEIIQERPGRSGLVFDAGLFRF